MEKLLYGRKLLWSELSSELQVEINRKTIAFQTTSSFIEKKRKIHCRRCTAEMTPVKKGECICGEECSYCRNCLNMGKVRQCALFYHLPEKNKFQTYSNEKLLAWAGTLSEQQSDASQNVIHSIKEKETRLLWAVTGAGKTEMLFEGIEYALQQNLRICIATPRVDVCLELMPRLQVAFPTVDLAVLYGAMETPYNYTQFVLATTHQLFRFKEAFDVLIIDEIDAFPFHLDESLQAAAQRAVKKEATLIYLTATPNRKIQKEVTKNNLFATILPARYHRHPLPVPSLKWAGAWRKKLLKTPLHNPIGKKIQEKITTRRRCLIFVPNIEWMLQLEKTLKTLFPQTAIESVSALDPKRKEKVSAMRNSEIQLLLTTTILERGVTLADIDVLVIGAEDRIFTEAALVQIAGRCGRSAKYPTGEVIFFHHGQTKAMKQAVKQIKQMNHLAQRRGLLNG